MPQKIDPKLAPIRASSAHSGMPGMTAYAGLFRIAAFKPTDTVFVSAASGAVGSVVCQLAKAQGAYVVGSARFRSKSASGCWRHGIDRAINYRKEADLDKAVRAGFPKGIDVYFENVGGKHLEAALNHMRVFGRHRHVRHDRAVQQHRTSARTVEHHHDDPQEPAHRRALLLSNHYDLLPKFSQEMGKLIAEGKMKWQESVTDGLQNARMRSSVSSRAKTSARLWSGSDPIRQFERRSR
jgi:NADPH-dependent curcumin reductase CurA